ncbi:hypothetical protein [Emcibacter sp. SYSU 3D8]|uniref:hypothetical protein n=1 Tax=Emcibacter sp. SYSU 3D8 TaxID=3133969 RepID=UPI0031FEE84F
MLLPAMLGVLLLAAGPAQALAPIRDYLSTGEAGERDHAYPLMRCGALYMSSLKVAGAGVTPDKAENVMQTAMKMIAIATSFRMTPGDDPTATANGVMDEVERMVEEYGAESAATGRGSLVKQDFKYCRNFAEPFARNYDMDPPQAVRQPRPVPRETPAPQPQPRRQEPEIRPGDVPGAPLPH